MQILSSLPFLTVKSVLNLPDSCVDTDDMFGVGGDDMFRFLFGGFMIIGSVLLLRLNRKLLYLLCIKCHNYFEILLTFQLFFRVSFLFE